NQPDNSANSVYDIYLKDISKIKILNDYLANQYNTDKKAYLSINYFNNRKIAKTYFEKQLSESVSESEKDRLFKNYIAVYKFNPSTGFDQLSFLHQELSFSPLLVLSPTRLGLQNVCSLQTAAGLLLSTTIIVC
ncbi:MAG: hypothetical protein ABI203_10980, partial [Mucilaginibacter sp.]